jgi:hypothetical protein
MESDLVQVGKELSPILVAFIGAAAGLVSGTIASLIAPWVQYAIESRKKSFEYKQKLIADIKSLLDSNSDMNDIEKSSLWGFISENLNNEEKKIVYSGAIVCRMSTDGSNDTLTQDDLKKQGISQMIYRLEKEWNLVKT